MPKFASHASLPRLVVAALFVIHSLAACGGGGGGDSGSAAANQQPAAGSGNSDVASGLVFDPAPQPAEATAAAAPPATNAQGTSTENPAGVSWSVVDLSARLAPHSTASALNDGGMVVGHTADPSKPNARPPVQEPFLYHNGTSTSLGSLGGSYGDATAVNSSGQVVGYSYVSQLGQTHAFLYSGGKMTDLGTLQGSGGSWARDINDAGQIVGHSTISDGTGGFLTRAFLYSDGSMRSLGTLGGRESFAAAISNVVSSVSHVAGWSYTAENAQRAFLYNGTALINLGALAGTSSSYATDVNRNGQVVGVSYTIGGEEFRAFIYQNGAMSDLGSLGGSRSSATAINDAGQVVGWSNTAEGQQHAYLHSEGGMTDLNALPGVASSGWVLQSAIAINNAGQIMGYGTLNGERRTFLLSPP